MADGNLNPRLIRENLGYASLANIPSIFTRLIINGIRQKESHCLNWRTWAKPASLREVGALHA